MDKTQRDSQLPAFRTTEEIHDKVYQMAVTEDRSLGYIIHRELSKSLNPEG